MGNTHENDASSTERPLVSIGLAVYNGENYLRQSVQSILDQTFTDYELIISDNCSTDNTESICREFLEKSDKIRYFRQDKNRGASANFEFTFQQSRGKYFKWQGHDDIAYPQYLEKCVARLEENPDAVLCQSHVARIDADGELIRVYAHEDFDTTDPDPVKRFAGRLRSKFCSEIIGVMPRSVLEKSVRLGPFVSHDRCLLSQLSLMGRFLDVPEVLFAFRVHPAQFTQSFHRPGNAMFWFDPERAAWPTMPRLTHFFKCIGYIHSADLPRSTRLRCYGVLLGAQINLFQIRGIFRELRRLAKYGVRQVLTIFIRA